MATRDRAPVLERCLTAMAQLRSPPGGFELVVVDNGSIDDTAQVLGANYPNLPLRRLIEERPGKNVALNFALSHLGARASNADLLVFCDDDVIPQPDWLCALLAAAVRFPSVDLFGGGIDIVWTRSPPSWISAFAPFFGILFAETTSESGPCPTDALWGPNLALRGRLFTGAPLFNEEFGPNGRQDFAMGSETELLARLGALGISARFVGEARVGHMIDGAVLTRESVLRRARRHGRGVIRRDPKRFNAPFIFGVPLATLRGLLVTSLRAAVASEPSRSHALFSRAWHLGVFGEAFTLAASPLSSRPNTPRRTALPP
jgi:glycosyltransferase involved in cell wall biosynthesis